MIRPCAMDVTLIVPLIAMFSLLRKKGYCQSSADIDTSGRDVSPAGICCT